MRPTHVPEGSDSLPIIGRERMLVSKLAKRLEEKGAAGHETTPVVETRRGATFRVRMYDGSEYSGRIARVTVDFEEVEQAT